MATTYDLISSNVLTGNTSSITFSSIPATYTDLVVKMSIRDGYVGGGNPNTFQTSFLTFNGSSVASYSRTYLWGTGSAAASGTASGLTSYYLQFSDSDGATANTFSNTEIYIPNYLSSNLKSSQLFAAQEDNISNAYVNLAANLWSNTSAITSITITNGAGQLVTGSSFYLYGIKNS
jgi:hypothetical protein